MIKFQWQKYETNRFFNRDVYNVPLTAGEEKWHTAGKLMRLEIRALLKNNYGGTVPASWIFRGRTMNIPLPMPTTTLTFKADFYKHIIDGEEKYYIDISKCIRRVDGIDQLQSIREILRLED